MKDEIKETLDKLQLINNCEFNFTYTIIQKPEAKALLNYITNLQQENERLKDELEQNKNPLRGIFAQVTDDDLLRNNAAMYAELEDYKSRCEKAIELINKWVENIDNWDKTDNPYDYYIENNIGLEDLVDILGGDEE